MSKYVIYGEFEDQTEVVDKAEDEFSADYLVGEYKLAFGRDWHIWHEEKGDDNVETH